jgi:hypothetical protein
MCTVVLASKLRAIANAGPGATFLFTLLADAGEGRATQQH